MNGLIGGYAPATLAVSSARSRVLVRAEKGGAYAVRCLRTDARVFLRALKTGGELSILVTSDAAIRRLNKTWRVKDRPTDVLSFGAGSGLLGDVVISIDTARRQAKEHGHSLADELARLLAHGLLHLLGYDHEQPTDARRMARAEVALLGSVGLVGDALGIRPADLEFTRGRSEASAAEAST